MIIAFVGFGNMGYPIAVNLIKAGFTVHAYNRTMRKLEHLRFPNLKVFDRPEAAVREADVVITMLSDDAAVKEISSKMLPAMKRGSIHMAMSTIAPTTATFLKKESESFGVSYVASPVLGRPAAAESKQLVVMLAGDQASKDKLEPVLKAFSQRTYDYGLDPSTANMAKVLLNYMIFITSGMLSELFLTAENTGVDKRKIFETLSNTAFGSPIVKGYGELLLEEKDSKPGQGFSTRLASKDLRLMQEAAAAKKIRLPLADAVQAQFADIIHNQQAGDRDLFMLLTNLRAKAKL